MYSRGYNSWGSGGGIYSSTPQYGSISSSYSTSSSHTSAPYPLINDSVEEARLDEGQALYRLLEPTLFPAYATRILSSSYDCKILDIGCGTGAFCIDVAVNHPSVEVIGVDMEYIQKSAGQRLNCRFDNFNILAGMPYAADSFDIIVMRDFGLAIPNNSVDYLINQCAELLRPNGVLVIVERSLDFGGANADGAAQLSEAVEYCCKQLGVNPRWGEDAASILQDSGLFADIGNGWGVKDAQLTPNYSYLSSLALKCTVSLFHALRPLLLNEYTADEADLFICNAINSISDGSHVARWNTIEGIKL